VVVLAQLSACATRPDDIRPQYVSSDAYASSSCEELARRAEKNQLRLAQLSDQINHNANVDAARVAGAVAMAVVLPFWFVKTHGSGPQQAEYAQLLGEQRAIRERMQQANCSSELVAVADISYAADVGAPNVGEEKSSLSADPRVAALRDKLLSNDARAVQATAKSLVAAEVTDRSVLDLVAAKLGQWQYTLDKREASAAAWLCKVLGQSRDGRYKQLMGDVAAGALSPQVRKYAEWAADELPVGVSPQYVYRAAQGGPPSVQSQQRATSRIRGEASVSRDPMTRLKELQDMFESGLITREQYEKKQGEILRDL
jgi:hypothetical protein